jgi:hypothetical protein
MKNKKVINILVILIILITIAVSLVGIISSKGGHNFEYVSINNETVQIYGSGIYKNDSVAVVAQGLAQDLVSLIMGIPLLIGALVLFNKGKTKGKLLLSGALGYFLYTYMSYSFLWNYNSLFLLYVALMSLSAFALVLTIMNININNLKNEFNDKLPRGFIGGVQIFIGIMIGLMWLAKIVPSIINNSVPVGLEHYTTLIIQAMDLAFVTPLAILSGILLIKRNRFGYLLSSIMIIKGSALLISITAMIVGQMIVGVDVNYIVIAIFGLFNLLMIYPLILLIKNIKE